MGMSTRTKKMRAAITAGMKACKDFPWCLKCMGTETSCSIIRAADEKMAELYRDAPETAPAPKKSSLKAPIPRAYPPAEDSEDWRNHI